MDYLSLKIPGYKEEIQAPNTVPTGGLDALNNVLSVGMGVFVVASIVLGIGALVYGGYLWVTSGGDKEKVAKARNTILYTFIGILLSVLALSIINVVGHMLGFNYFSIPFTGPGSPPPDCGSGPPGQPC